jgi:hypothetical protein
MQDREISTIKLHTDGNIICKTQCWIIIDLNQFVIATWNMFYMSLWKTCTMRLCFITYKAFIFLITHCTPRPGCMQINSHVEQGHVLKYYYGRQPPFQLNEYEETCKRYCAIRKWEHTRTSHVFPLRDSHAQRPKKVAIQVAKQWLYAFQ